MANTHEVPLVIEDCAIMTAGVEYGSSLSGLEPGFDPAKAQDLIEDFIRRFRGGQVQEELDENAAAYLGVFWGMTVVLAYDWNWVAVADGAWRGFGVADPERRYLALPIRYFHLLMHDKAGDKMPRPESRFKAIGTDDLPESKPGALTLLWASADEASTWFCGVAFNDVESKGSQMEMDVVNSLSLSLDGKRALAGSPEGVAFLWDASNGTRFRILTGHEGSVVAVNIGVDGKWALTGSYDKTAILWDVNTGEQLRSFAAHSDWVLSVRLSYDGKRAVTGSMDNTAILWDAQTGTKIHTFTGHESGVLSVALSKDGSRVLTGSYDQTAILWDAENGRKLRTSSGHSEVVESVSLSADRKRMLTGSDDCTAILWDAKSGKKLRTFGGHQGWIMCVDLSADGKRALTASQDRTVILWDADTGKKLRTFVGHSESVLAASLSADGRHVWTAAEDQTMRVWDARTGQELCRLLSLDAGKEWVVVTAEGAFAGSPNVANFISGGKETTPALSPLQAYRKHVEQPDLLAKILK
jgi:hypothetical protein